MMRRKKNVVVESDKGRREGRRKGVNINQEERREK